MKKKKHKKKLLEAVMRIGGELKKVKEKEAKEERAFLKKRLGTEEPREIKRLEYKREQYKEKYKKERVGKVLSGTRETAERLTRVGEGFVKKPLLRRPKAVLIKKLDPVQAAIKAGQGKTKFVKEGRTGYFNEEMMEEAKWLG
ncbi:hypothetical protein BMS3Abin17_00095 [archaeon BMS3Abin17]|nr:hypothetical protein BMS3Abin17_00095 [archaeon BMS3Abin17]HDZ60159.1 hypothetical protein [Candidatus Pacearchaeota archaeon]